METFGNHTIRSEYLRFKNNDRLLDILVYSEGSTVLLGDFRYEEIYIPEGGINPSRGLHGYDDTSPGKNS
jgi:hypothetical protein